MNGKSIDIGQDVNDYLSDILLSLLESFHTRYRVHPAISIKAFIPLDTGDLAKIEVANFDESTVDTERIHDVHILPLDKSDVM